MEKTSSKIQILKLYSQFSHKNILLIVVYFFAAGGGGAVIQHF